MTLSLHDALELAGILVGIGGFMVYVRSAVSTLKALTAQVTQLDKRVTLLEDRQPKRRR